MSVVTSLRTLESVRTKCYQIFNLAEKGLTPNWKVQTDKIPGVVNRVVDLINKNHPSGIPPFHGRCGHFRTEGLDRVANLKQSWKGVDQLEIGRRLVDLVTVSVLLDAGAGKDWVYNSKIENKSFNRSEGLAIASLEIFNSGLFSSSPDVPYRVDSSALKKLTINQLEEGLQVSPTNPLVGLGGRTQLLNTLGFALEDKPQYFGKELFRPGNIIDYLLSLPPQVTQNGVSVNELWKVIVESFECLWPKRGDEKEYQPGGDIWAYSPLKTEEIGSELVPIHKLSQWLLYSLIEPIQEASKINFVDMHIPTALAEYRNGGLLVDAGVLEPKIGHERLLSETHEIGSELIVEWRALTICLMDKIGVEVRKSLNLTEEQLPLGRILEGGTWQAGRDIAKEKREDGSSPISIKLTGCVF